jgi:hypothetical protein
MQGIPERSVVPVGSRIEGGRLRRGGVRVMTIGGGEDGARMLDVEARFLSDTVDVEDKGRDAGGGGVGF